MLLINLQPNVKGVIEINGEKIEIYNLEKTISHLGIVADKKFVIYREDCDPRGKHLKKKMEKRRENL